MIIKIFQLNMNNKPYRKNAVRLLFLRKERINIMNKTKENTIIEKEYFDDLQKIKDTIRTNQNKAMVVVNSAMIMTYYEIGTIINQRKQWGNKYIYRLSKDLKNYGKGYSTTNLKRMSQFAKNISWEELRQQVVAQIAWGSIIQIMSKTSSHEEMIWYINQTYKNGWSRTILLNKIKMKAYDLKSIDTIKDASILDSNINEMFNSTLVFDFIDKNKIKNERDLENSLLDNITKFILELGNGFAFVGRQFKLEIPGGEYYPDLIFYNYILHSFVIIDLKTTPYKPEYLGKMIFYVNIANDVLKGDKDNPTIGLILCAESDNIIIKYSFGNINSPIKVSEYKFIEELPQYLERKLKEIK